MTSRLKFCFLLLITLLTFGCSVNQSIYPTQIKSEVTSFENQSYPVFTQTPNMLPNSYPVEQSEDPQKFQHTPTFEPIIIPEPDPNNGIITGKLLSYTTNEVLPYVKIYMATKVPLEPGPGYVISFQKESSPQADTNGKGEFIIEEIPPSEYVILLVTPFGSYPLLNDEAEQVEMDISSGTIYTLGEVYVNWP